MAKTEKKEKTNVIDANLIKESMMTRKSFIEPVKPKVVFTLLTWTNEGKRFIKFIRSSEGVVVDFELVNDIRLATKTSNIDEIRYVVAQNLSDGRRTDAYVMIQ